MAALYYVFGSLASAKAVAATVDPAMGYPRAGVDVGAGVHVAPGPFATATYAAPLAHPTLALWAYPADANVVPIVGPAAVVLGLPVAAALDGTWTGAVPVEPVAVQATQQALGTS